METSREQIDQLTLMNIFSENCSSSNRSKVDLEPGIPLRNSHYDYGDLDLNYPARKVNQESLHEKIHENFRDKRNCEREQQSMPTTSENIFPLFKSANVDKSGKLLTKLPSKDLLNTTHSPCRISEADMKNSRQEKKRSIFPLRKVLKLKRSHVYPLRFCRVPPIISKNSQGCKSVVVSGLSRKVTAEVLREIFENCGKVCSIRMFDKHRYQVRFDCQISAKRAINFTGCRISVDFSGNRPRYCANMIVDYDYTDADKYQSDYDKRESLQSEAHYREREQLSRERIVQEILRPETPPSVVPFSFADVKSWCKQLQSEKTFSKAASVLTSWLEKGACNKLNVVSFYSMLENTYRFVELLINEKAKFVEEATKTKMLLKMQMQGMLLQFKDILKIFNAACVPTAWDHFTDEQKKSIEKWRKQTEKLNQAHLKEVLNDQIEDKMDVGEDEAKNDETLPKEDQGICDDKAKYEDESNKLRLEIDILRCQLETAENEKLVLQTENKELECERRRVQALNSTLQELTRRIKVLSQKRSTSDAELKKYPPSKSSKSNDNSESDLSKSGGKLLDSENVNASVFRGEARLIGLVSTFLLVHPCSSTDSICSYLRQVNSKIMPKQVEVLMDRYPGIFRVDSTGIGENLERKWNFVGLQS